MGREQHVLVRPLLEEARREAEQRAQLEAAREQNLGDDPKRWAEAIKKLATVDQWLQNEFHQKQKFNLYGKGLMAIGTIFGLEAGRNFDFAERRIELAIKIWGEGDEVLTERLQRELATVRASKELLGDPDRLAETIQQLVTAEEWLAWGREQRQNFKLHAKGLAAIATSLGVEGNPGTSRIAHCELALKIWPDEREAIEASLAEARGEAVIREAEEEAAQALGPDPQKWAEAIRTQMDAETWLALSKEQRRAFKIHGRGLQALATLLGIEGDPIENRQPFLEMATKIWGETIAVEERRKIRQRKKVERLKLQPDEVAQRLKETISAEQWVNMTSKQRIEYRLEGMSLRVIAGILGVRFVTEGGNVAYNTSAHIALGAKVFGEDDPAIKAALQEEEKNAAVLRELGLDTEKWREALKQKISADQWMASKCDDRLEFKFHGAGMGAIARVFGIEGDPINQTITHYELGAAIFGENNPDVQPLLERERREVAILNELGKDQEKWRRAVQDVLTAEQWVSLKYDGKSQLKIHGQGLQAVGTIFGIKGNPIDQREAQLALGLAIYGEHPSIVAIVEQQRAEMAALQELGQDQEKWREYIRQRMSLDQWQNTTYRSRSQMKFLGQGLQTIAKIFGIEGNPGGQKEAFLELTKAIYFRRHEWYY